MRIPRPHALRICRVCFFCLLILGMTLPAQSLLAQDGRIYLPIVSGTPPTELFGTATFQGAPTSGQYVTLYMWTGTEEVLIETVRTDSKGMFRFVDVAPLLDNQRYYAFYHNRSDGNIENEGLVSYCGTDNIDELAVGSQKWLGDFDIANFSQNAPDHDSTVSLPTTFSWYNRADLPQDNYSLFLYDPSDSSVGEAFTNLGNIGSLTVTREMLPTWARSYEHAYGWSVSVRWDQSVCSSHYAYYFYFKR